MWVDLEPPLTAAGSGPAMAAAASQGTERVEGDATAGCETLSLCEKEQSSMLLGRRFGFAGDEGPRRGAARRRRVHPLVVACASEGPMTASLLSPIRSRLALVAARKREEGVERMNVLGFGGENRAPVLFRLKIRATVGSR
jgi:hypothetical protein